MDNWILFSKRKFKKAVCDVTLKNGVLQRLNVIFQVHGKQIKHLEIENVIVNRQWVPKICIDAEYLIAMFKQLPSLSSLSWSVTNTEIVNWIKDDTILKELDTLVLYVDEKLTENFVNMFPENKIWTVDFVKWNQLENFIKRQSSIVDLSVDEQDVINVEQIYANLHLESYMIGTELNDLPDKFTDFLNGHHELKNLTIINCEPSSNVVAAIGDLELLEELDLTVTHGELEPLENLHNLKKISICVEESWTQEQHLVQIFERISSLHLPTAEVITLGFFDAPCSLKLEIAGRHWESLKDLTIHATSNSGIDILNLFLDYFPKLEALAIKFQKPFPGRGENLSSNENQLFFDGYGQLYPKLKKLILNGIAGLRGFREMLMALPNLKQLEMSPLLDTYETTLNHSSNFYHLLEMEKLKDLTVSFKLSSHYPLEAFISSVSLLRRLCINLSKFSISFTGSNESITTLNDLIRGWNDYEIAIDSDGKRLIIENYKY